MTFVSRLRYGLSAAALLLGPLVSVVRAQTPVYLKFHVPGSIATFPLSINDSMTVTGYWVDHSSNTHGFVRQASGVITSFDVPGSPFTEPVSINKSGEITGYYEVITGTLEGFVRQADGRFNFFTEINTGNGNENFLAQPVKINTSGEVIGNFPYPLAEPSPFTRSAAGALQFFSLSLGASYPTYVSGLNDSGAIVGYATSDSLADAQGYLWSGQGQVPSPENDIGTGITVPGSTGTFPTSINAGGSVVGCYSIDSTYYDFVRTPNGTITKLNVPGTVPSCLPGSVPFGPAPPGLAPFQFVYNVAPAPISMNDQGTILGTYTNSANVQGAFTQSASGSITTFTVPNGAMTQPTALNNAGDVIGTFYQGTEVTAFLRLPSESCCTGAPVNLTVEDPQGYFWDGGGSKYGVTALQVYQDYASKGQDWTWTAVPGGFNVCTLSTVCLSDNGSRMMLSANADVLNITSTGAVLDLNTGEYIENAASPGNGVYLSTGPTASSWNFSFNLH